MISRRTHVDQGDRLLMMQEEPENMRNINDKFQVWKKRRSLHMHLSKSLGKCKQFEKETLETQHVETWCNFVADLQWSEWKAHQASPSCTRDPRLPETLFWRHWTPTKTTQQTKPDQVFGRLRRYTPIGPMYAIYSPTFRWFLMVNRRQIDRSSHGYFRSSPSVFNGRLGLHRLELSRWLLRDLEIVHPLKIDWTYPCLAGSLY